MKEFQFKTGCNMVRSFRWNYEAIEFMKGLKSVLEEGLKEDLELCVYPDAIVINDKDNKPIATMGRIKNDKPLLNA